MRIGLALSGGGFRATLYHLGMVRYLRDANLLESVSHITSVSGGSVLAAHLVLNWDRYCGDSNEFDCAAQEILDFVRLDVRNRIVRRYPFVLAEDWARRVTRTRRRRPLTRTVLLEQHYQQYLFGDTCLYQLPRSPELHILCTNLSGGGLSSFTRDGLLMEQRTNSGESTMRLHHVGLATVPMAVTASSAFPGFFPPLELTAETVGAASGEFQTQFFTDGGVYDNLGVRMFHHINTQIKKTLRQTDFVDVAAAMQAWNQAPHHQEATALGRVAEIYAETSGRNHTSILEDPQKFVDGLHDLTSGGELQRDKSLQHLLNGTEQDNHGGNGSSNGNGRSHQDCLSRNRQLLQLAFQRTAGKEVLQLQDQPFDAILASDAGKKIQVTGDERIGGFLGTAMRSSDILMDRVWQLEQEHFKNASGVIFSPISRIVSHEEDPTALHPEVQFQVSHIRTDMDRFHDREVSGLIRHGYCVARQSLALHPGLDASPHRSDPSPWDPTSHASAHSSPTAGGVSRRGAPPVSHTIEARKLQSSAYRKYWSLITAPRDWVTYLYIPVLLMLFGLLPWMGWRYVRHIRTNVMLSGAITQSRQDYDHLLAMLENGPVDPWEPIEYDETDELSPLFAEQGLDMICDARIIDLRNWQPNTKGMSGTPDNRIYVCRHVSLRKIDHAEGPTALLMQSLLDYPDVLLRCNNPEFKPVIRRCNMGTDGEQGPYRWEVQLDFSHVSVGETVHLMVEAIVLDDSHKDDFDSREWWRYEVDGDPELAAAWILLPENRSYADFQLVKYDYSVDERVTIVHPTRLSVIRHGTILNWGVVHPDPGMTYSCRWKRDL